MGSSPPSADNPDKDNNLSLRRKNPEPALPLPADSIDGCIFRLSTYLRPAFITYLLPSAVHCSLSTTCIIFPINFSQKFVFRLPPP